MESLETINQMQVEPTITVEIMEDLRNTDEDLSKVDELGNSEDGSIIGFHKVCVVRCIQKAIVRWPYNRGPASETFVVALWQQITFR